MATKTETDYLLHDKSRDFDGHFIDHMDDCDGNVNYYTDGAQKLQNKNCNCCKSRHMTYCERTAQCYAKMEYKPLIFALCVMLIIIIYYAGYSAGRFDAKRNQPSDNTTNHTYEPSPISASSTERQQQFILVDSNRNYSSEVIDCLEKYIISSNSIIMDRGSINTTVAKILNVSSIKLQYHTIRDMLDKSFNIGTNSVIVLTNNLFDFVSGIKSDDLSLTLEYDLNILWQNWIHTDKLVRIFVTQRTAVSFIAFVAIPTNTYYIYRGNSLLC